jgi:hypothetical protein
VRKRRAEFVVEDGEDVVFEAVLTAVTELVKLFWRASRAFTATTKSSAANGLVT